MISLHKLMEDGIELRGVFADHDDRCRRDLKIMLNGVKCFDLGNAEAFRGRATAYEVAAEVEAVRFPYEHCWFEFTTEINGIETLDRCHMGVLIKRHDDGFDSYAFVWLPVARRFMLCMVARTEAGQISVVALEKDDAAAAYFGFVCFNPIFVFLKMLACVNVDTLEIKPDRALQKARLKRGKIPLFSSWVCVLKGKSAQGEWLGGTHASPRLHYRRGHVRNLEEGRAVWVRECMVGNKELGLVEKSYMRAPDLGRAAVGVSCE